MVSWKKVYFNAQNVEAETEKAVLINLPHNSKFDGFRFWHPRKLVRSEGNKGYKLSFSFTEDFSFKIFKNGNGQYNKRDVIDQKTITPSDIMAAFGMTLEN